MRIIRLQSENVLRLHAVYIRADRTMVRVTGENGSGKSSVLNSIFYALAGKQHHPTRPIRDGENKASIRLDLGEGDEVELSIIRRFTPSGTYLDVETPQGATFKSPQSVLDRLIGTLTFDPLEFARLAPKAQLEQLRGIVKVDADLEKLDAEWMGAFATRTDVNRAVKSVTERVKTLAADVHADLDVEPISVRALMDQMEQAVAHNTAIERDAAKREAEGRRLSGIEGEMVRLKAEIATLTDRLVQAEAEHIAGVRALLAWANAPAPIDTALLRIAIDDAQTENARRATEVRSRQAHQAAVAELATLTAKATALTATIEDAQAIKQDAIARAHMPVEGLSFGDGEIIYKGVPFAQASSAEQWRVATAIGMALNPKLRIICIRDGSLLDAKSLGIIEQMAEEHDFQVWIETVSAKATVGIHMVDGAVAAVDGVPVPAEEEGEVTVVGAAL